MRVEDAIQRIDWMRDLKQRQPDVYLALTLHSPSRKISRTIAALAITARKAGVDYVQIVVPPSFLERAADYIKVMMSRALQWPA